MPEDTERPRIKGYDIYMPESDPIFARHVAAAEAMLQAELTKQGAMEIRREVKRNPNGTFLGVGAASPQPFYSVDVWY